MKLLHGAPGSLTDETWVNSALKRSLTTSLVPDKWAEEVRAWRDVGAEYVSMRGMALRGQGEGLKSPQEHIDILSTYWAEVGELSG